MFYVIYTTHLLCLCLNKSRCWSREWEPGEQSLRQTAATSSSAADFSQDDVTLVHGPQTSHRLHQQSGKLPDKWPATRLNSCPDRFQSNQSLFVRSGLFLSTSCRWIFWTQCFRWTVIQVSSWGSSWQRDSTWMRTEYRYRPNTLWQMLRHVYSCSLDTLISLSPLRSDLVSEPEGQAETLRQRKPPACGPDSCGWPGGHRSAESQTGCAWSPGPNPAARLSSPERGGTGGAVMPSGGLKMCYFNHPLWVWASFAFDFILNSVLDPCASNVPQSWNCLALKWHKSVVPVIQRKLFDP